MKNRRKTLRYLCFGLLAVLAPILLWFGGCRKSDDIWANVEGGPKRVLVSFPPLYCFTRAVADKDVKVVSLLAMVGPHGFRPGQDEAQVAHGADLFLVNGLKLDDFVTVVASRADNPKLKMVKVADEALPEDKRLAISGDDHAGHEGHDHGKWDPHAWLGIEQAVLMVRKIAAVLKETDPEHAADYDRRANDYVKKLEDLQAEGKKLLKGKQNRKIIAMHESLGYFCKSFDLEVVASIMPQPGVEASSAQMAKLVDLCQEQNVRVIAVEPQYRKDVAESLKNAVPEAKRAGITIVEIDPLETATRADLDDPDYYFKVMRKNLDNLNKAMK
jgi:ABC-type Zn uptake system ZnuABC Zn-binding protein ZnuA